MRPAFTKEQLVKQLRYLGVEDGSTLMAHTSYKSIKPVEGGPEAIVDAMLAAVGPSGTLILPTFTFEYCNTRVWDRENTASETGIISELFRVRDGVKRSSHPIYSVAAAGALAEEFTNADDENGVGSRSPFALLTRHDALVAALGANYNQAFTLGHHIEWSENVDYRHTKAFPGEIVTNGVKSRGDYSMLVRNVDQGVMTDYRKFGAMLEHAEAMRVGRFGWAIGRVIDAKDFDELTRKWLREGVPDLMHRKEEDMDEQTIEELRDSYFRLDSAL